MGENSKISKSELKNMQYAYKNYNSSLNGQLS